MPRPGPGPRPYECVRRAWHSDRHQPMRGTFIQRILRVVHDVHKPETRQNYEWQTKLPTVVMRAEQILYSKANSEVPLSLDAEYLNPENLSVRLDDAINTIIRREDTETGQYIRPCIEAALLLGCVPVRESRSQQLKNPRKYLNRNTEEPAQGALPIVNNTNTHKPPPPRSPIRPIRPRNQSTSPVKANLGSTSAPFCPQMAPSTSRMTTHTGPQLLSTLTPLIPPCMATEPNTSANTSVNCGSVYPLYYGQNVESQGEFFRPQNSYLRNVLMGRPVGWPARQPDYSPSTMNLLPDESVEITRHELRRVEPVDSCRKAVVEDCDLSLRLGPSYPSTMTEKELAYGGEDGGSSSRLESIDHLAKNLGFCFFPSCSISDPILSEQYTNEVENGSEFQEQGEASRKRKALTIMI